jgi:Uma2 family endonuclease
MTAGELTNALEKEISRLAPDWLAQNPDLHERLVDALADGPDQVLRFMTYEEFLEWTIHEEIRAEWVDGKVFLMTSPSLRHQLLSMFLGSLLNFYVTSQDLGIFVAPFQMRLTQPNRGREPDLLFISTQNAARLRNNYLNGPADLVVEIVSPDSIRRDREEKLSEYEAAGVPEYWIIDPEREEALFYQLVGGHYQLVLGGRMGRYTSAIVPGFWLEVEWLWQNPLPPVAEIWQQRR